MENKKEKIVVIDDEAGIRELFQTAFEDVYTILSAPNLSACVQLNLLSDYQCVVPALKRSTNAL